MKPQTDPRLSGCAWHVNLTALVPLALLAVSLPAALSAQQTVPQESQPKDSQNAPVQIPQTIKPKPSPNHYPATPPPQDAQQPDQVSHAAPAPDPSQAPHPRHTQPQHHPAVKPDPTPDAGPELAQNQAPEPVYPPTPNYTQQPYSAPQQAPDPGYPQNYSQPYSQPQYSQPQYGQPNFAQQPYSPPDPSYPQPYTQPGYDPQPQQAPIQQGPTQQAMDPQQLEQLVAPIALYPDTLVAQVLAAATYPAQVVGADHWVQVQGYAPPDQIAYAAAAEPWDPSVKALTAFPQVLALMDRDLQWTTDLGNAYYNQPQDVLQTVQVLRQRALSAGTLQNTPQESLSDNQGYLQIAPANPEVVYVPAYNPWDVYGQPIQPYSGFSLLGSLASFAGSAAVRFGPGVGMAAFNHTPFGWATWALDWLTQSVLFHQSNYLTHSTSVARWNTPGRGGFPSRGVNPGPGPRPSPRPMDSYNRAPGNYARPSDYNRPSPNQSFNRAPEPYAAYRNSEAPNRAYNNNVRPAYPSYAYNRPQQTEPVRPQTYNRPGSAYGSGFYSNPAPSNATRPATPYARQQALREPTPQFSSRNNYNNYAQRSYAQPYSDPRAYNPSRSYESGRTYAQAQPNRSGGSHFFGGHDGESSHESYRAPKEPRYKAPKPPKEHGGHSGGSHHSGGGHRF